MTVLEPMGKNLWMIDGPVVRAYGFPFPTRMVVARLLGGGLWIWSPIRYSSPSSSRTFRRQRAEVARHAGEAAAKKLAVDVVDDKDGKPSHVMFTPGAVKPTFGPGRFGESVTAPSGAAGEVPLASPAGH